ncbi:PREDICTED: protein terminal ear1 homolog [Tarenaya hassleriana]|uniref:protein terminal ear1 homolog n=1 Tax=Tarenaya hassleriana TaxID=28532 RepID=UPI00053C12A1|nr:PREDICTED: protein terminal ear1 homolog [Tarenaya hassleriana]
MDDAGAFLFAGNLDPRAQEFLPMNPITTYPTRIPLPTQLYLPPPPPPPPLPYPYGFPASPRVVTFFNAPTPPPYFGVSPAPQLPRPSTSPTRALALISVPSDVSESMVRRDLEVYGDVRGVQMERAYEGIVTVHFYDLRDAETALREICAQHMHQQLMLGAWSSPPSPVPSRGLVRGRAVWAQFVVPATSVVPGGFNQGTLVIFNLDPSVSSVSLRQIFQVYGPIRELRGTPFKQNQRFVEFYDVRDAAKALEDMNGKEINGKQVGIEFSRPGGRRNKFRLHPQPPPPLLHQPVSDRSLVSTKEKKKKPMIFSGDTNPNGSIEASVHSLCIENSPRGTVSGAGEGKNRISCSWAKWGKRRHVKSLDAQFLISEETVEDSGFRDPRTTLMIKNIPNKYSQKLLLNVLDGHCIRINEQVAEPGDESRPLSSYDFVYLPMDFNNKCNVGYGFVNMTTPEAAWRLYKAFHLQRWEVFNSRKICEITYARVQGLEALKEHFKSSKFPGQAELYLPVFFSPPRDGRILTEPVPINIIGRNRDQTDGQDDSTYINHDDSHLDATAEGETTC